MKKFILTLKESFYINASEIDCLLLYSLLILLITVLTIFIIFITVKISSASDFTIRKIIFSRKSSKSNKKRRKIKEKKRKNILFEQILINNKLLLEKCGMYNKKNLLIIILIKWILIPLTSFFVFSMNAISGNKNFFIIIITFLFLEFTTWLFLNLQIKKESDKFKIASYKLFKFLRNQLSAGIKITDAINSLHTVVSNDNTLLKTRLILMASHYSSTNNIDEALLYITNYYNSTEAKSLALAIKQSIETGKGDTGFEQKEKKLFNLYLNVIKKNTQVLLLKYFLIGILYGLVIIIIIGYPQFLDLIEANRLLFGR